MQKYQKFWKRLKDFARVQKNFEITFCNLKNLQKYARICNNVQEFVTMYL